MISSFAEFAKTYKIPIPYAHEAEYYLEQLQRSPEFDELPQQIEAWEVFERAQSNGSQGVRRAQKKYQDRVIDFLKKSNAYRIMMERPLPTGNFPTQSLRNVKNRILLSVDMVKANYSVLQLLQVYLDAGKEKLPPHWETLCMILGIPLALKRSKSFRQIVFENLNPKRQQRFQLQVIHTLINELKRDGYWNERELVFLSPDEFIVDAEMRYTVTNGLTLSNSTASLLKGIDAWNHEAIRLGTPQMRTSFFQLDPIPGKGETGYIKTNYCRLNAVHNVLHRTHQLLFGVTHQSLFGVSVNRFHLNFKRHILKEDPDPRDLYFMNEKHLAQWVV